MADMTTKILTVELQADKAINGIIGLNDAIGKNTDQMKANAAQIKQNNAEIEKGTGDVMKLTAQNQVLAQSNVELSAKTKVLKDERRLLQKETQNEIKLQTEEVGSINQLETQLRNLKMEYKRLSEEERKHGARGIELREQINKTTTELKKAENEIQEYYRNVGNYPEAMGSVKGALRTMQDEIINLTVQYRLMDEEMRKSEAGQAMQAQIAKLTEEASNYKDAMEDVKQTIREGASDTRGLDTAIQAGQTLAATFGLAQNAAQALGLSTEGVEQAMLKMQQAMQAVQALQVIQNSLQKQSNLMRGIAIVQSKAAAAAEAIEARVKTQATGATIAQTVAQKAFNAVANANPYVLLATSILTVIGLIVGYAAATKDATKATSDETDSIDKQSKVVRDNTGAVDQNLTVKERLKQSEKEWSDAVTQNADNQISEYTKLQLKWLEVNKNQKDREKFQREYGDEVNRVAGRILKLSEYENFFVRDTDRVVAAILARAEAEAGAKKYAEATLKRAENDRNGTMANGRYYYNVSRSLNKGGNSARGEEMQAYERATGKSAVKGSGQSASGYKLTPEAQKWINDRRKETASAIKAADDAEIEYWKQFTTNAQRQAAAAEKAAGMGAGYKPPKTFGGSRGGSSKGGTGSTSKGSTSKKSGGKSEAEIQAEKEAKERQALADKLLKQAQELEQKAFEEQAKTSKEGIVEMFKQRNAALVAQYAGLGEMTEEEEKALQTLQKGLLDEQAKMLADFDAQQAKKREEQEKKAAEFAAKLLETSLDGSKEGTQGWANLRLQQIQMMQDAELEQYKQMLNNKIITQEQYEQMQAAIEAKYGQQRIDTQKAVNQAEIDAQEAKYNAISSIVGGVGEIFGALGEEQKEFAILQKTLALGEIMISQAVAIANAVKAGSNALNPWQMIAQIAASVVAVTSAMAQAFAALDDAKFATGGYIKGAGTGTSDSIPVRVSNGESIINANSTAMFGSLLSSLNQLGGGVPIQVQQTAASVRGEDMLARAVAKGVAMLPAPVVSVQDINRGQRQVEVMNERATL